MRGIAYVLISLLLITCYQKSEKLSSFDLLDVSIYNGWTDYYCMKIYNDGKTYIYNNNFRKGEKYFRVNFGQKEMDSISILVNLVLASQFDTLYESSCVDCGAYNLIIESKGKKFKSLVDGISPSNKEIKTMNKLISYLGNIAEISKEAIDSVFVFKSRTKQFYPPPPPPIEGQINYTVPDVIDTIH